MNVFQRGDSRYYHYDFQKNGIRYHGSTKCTDREEAEAFVARLLEVAEAENTETATMAQPPGPVTLGQVIDESWDHHFCQKGRGAETHNAATRCLDYIPGTTPLAELNATHMENLREGLRTRSKVGKAGRIAPGTANKSIGALRTVVRWACGHHQIPLPTFVWKRYFLRSRVRHIAEVSYAKQATIAKHLDAEDRAILKLIVGSAIPPAQACELSWNQVDLDKKRVTFVRYGHHVPQPIGDDIVALLRARLGNHPDRVFTYVANTCRGRKAKGRVLKGARFPVTHANFHRRWTIARQAAGLSVAPDDFRKTAGVRLTRLTQNLRLTQAFMHYRTAGSIVAFKQYAKKRVRKAMAANQAERAAARKQFKKMAGGS